MSYSDIYSSSSLVMFGNTFNVAETGLKFDYSTYNTSVQGGQPLICNVLRTDNTYDYCQVQHYYKSGSYWRVITVNNGFGSSFIDNLNSWTGFNIPYANNNTNALIAKLDPSTFSLIGFQWGGLPNTNSTRNLTQYHSVFIADNSSEDEPSGDTSADFSGIISAITLIPATIIMVCLFKMISNIFLNRKVRG